MEIYFSPLACSMASRIVAYEGGLSPTFRRVDTKARTVEGADYLAINPKGLVPAVRTDDGEVLTENSAVLQFLGDQAGLGPPAGGMQRYRLQQWLSFISTELHKTVFTPLLSPRYDAASKTTARDEAVKRFDYLDDQLAGREWLLDDFGVADAYLAVVLNWAQFVSLDLTAWPNIVAYQGRLTARPSVARALGEEMDLFRQAA